MWRTAVLEQPQGKLLPDEMARLRASLATEHPVFGDRRNALTLIGEKAACETFAAALRALCTDQEVQAWRAGKAFEDPWPQSVRAVDY